MLLLLSVFRNISFKLLLSLFLFYPLFLTASPWLESDDIYLRSDLQLLADAGFILVPVNSFPLPWRAISKQLLNASETQMNDSTYLAYLHVRHKMDATRKGIGRNFLKLKNMQEQMPTSFGQDNDVLWGAFSNVEINQPQFSMRISANYAQYHDKGDAKFNLDNSYFAVTTGKTNFFVSATRQWWSPSWIESLTQERRVHPSYELGLEKTIVALPMLGDLYFKTGINYLRSSDNWQYLWRSRISVRPVSALELSLSQFDFYKAQVSDIDEDRQQSSIDGRLSLVSLIDLPIAFYGQYLVDDSYLDTQGELLGADYSMLLKQWQMRFLFEYSKKSDSEMDQDIIRYSFGTNVQMANNHQWQLLLHQIEDKQSVHQLVGFYRFILLKGMLSLSLLLADEEDEDKINGGVSWEYRF